MNFSLSLKFAVYNSPAFFEFDLVELVLGLDHNEEAAHWNQDTNQEEYNCSYHESLSSVILIVNWC